MTMRTLTVAPVTPEAFAPFGALLLPPEEPGERALYSDWLAEPAAVPLQMHLNAVAPSMLPVTLIEAERHPAAAQAFVPVDVAIYLVVVFGSGDEPDLAGARAFLVPGTVGVVFAPGVWHASATVLVEKANFCVLMRRRNDGSDDEVAPLDEPLRIESAILG